MNGWIIFAIVYVIMTFSMMFVFIEKGDGAKEWGVCLFLGFFWWALLGAKVLNRILGR